MDLPSFFRHGDDRIALRAPDGTAYDVCALRHPDGAGGPEHARGCLVAALLEHERLLAAVRLGSATPVDPGPVRAPVPWPRNVFGAPVNYLEHRGELGSRSPAAGTVRDLGLFVKAGGSVSGPQDGIELPPLPDREFHYEGEIAVVVGRRGIDLSPAEALRHVAGFTGALDVTMRLEPDRREERSMRKSYRTFTPTGPDVLPLADPAMATTLGLRLSVDGELRQQGNLGELIMPVAELVALASSVVELEPGDLILTGTPAGVGPLTEGDTVRLEVDGLPPLALTVSRRAAP